MGNRCDRQETIRQLVRDRSIRTQHGLAEALREAGFECTQATVSRDVGEMGLLKLSEGSYVLAEDLKLQRIASVLVADVARARNIVIVKTTSGAASTVAAALDAADYPGVMGTVAGDDTVMVVAEDDAAAEVFLNFVGRLSEN